MGRLMIREMEQENVHLDLRDKRVTVAGFGVSGRAAAFLARALGAKVLVCENRRQEDFCRDLLERLGQQGIAAAFGPFAEENFLQADLIVLSPGIPPTLPVLREARRKGVRMIGEMELAARHLPAIPLIAVTGTNGKSTVTTLVGHILREAGLAPFVGGNLGEPLASFVLRERENPSSCQAAVLEVSSFQLEAIESFSPKIAVILNIAPDHLDRYANHAEYVSAKARIFRNMRAGSCLILNADDPQSGRFAGKAREQGVEVRFFSDEDEHFPRFPGKHNRENIAAARQVSRLLGIADEKIRAAIQSFKPLKHRLEWVGRVSGVAFYNDSKATNVHAACAALHAFDQPVCWIAGGYDGKEDYQPLREAAARQVKQAFLVGATKESLARALQGGCALTVCDSLGEALALAYAHADEHTPVVFSPACKSFDRYRDYQERGEHFRRLVHALTDDDSGRRGKEIEG